ncbi:DUF1631 family protein [Comamonadaceae bacterium G21597-S1]|nr:DUF1631 family protein [Comamonadaceae bacterium G21597-S1]
MSKYRLRRIGVASNASPTRPTLSDCLELVLDQANGLADDVLAALARLADDAGGDVLAQAPTEAAKAAIKALLAESTAVRATLDAELRRLVFHSSGKDLALNQAVRFEDLRFFDIREIEVHIELALARQEVIRATDDVLPQFDALVSALLGWSTVQSVLNPLKPETFVRALLETLTAWVPVEEVRMDLLRPSAIALGVGMRQLYRETCEWMRSQGVRPVDPAPNLSGDTAAARARKTQSEVERTMQTLEKLRRLLGNEPHAKVDLGAMQDFSHTVPGALVALQDLKLVEPMMQRLAERSVRQLAMGRPAARAGATIGQNRSREQNQQIGRMLGEEVVGLMVDQLVNDERLLMPVRKQLRSLEPALLQLARSDPRFFIDRRHAARQLLDRVVQRSLAYRAEDDEAIADFAACVSDAVNALSRSAGEASAYEQVLKELERAWDARDAARRERHEQEQRARDHTQQRLVLAQRFSDAMMERFRSVNLPELVASFLRGPWAQVLAETHLRDQGQPDDDTREDSRGYLALVDDLVWSVQLHLVRQDYARLVRMIPRLLARLHEGLLLIRYPQEPIALFLDQLSALHDKVLEDHRRAMAQVRASGFGAIAESSALEPTRDVDMGETGMGPLEPVAAEDDAEDDAGAGREDLLPAEQAVGARFALMLGGEWVPATLTWIGRNRNLFMFVSQSGLSHAMSRRTMDRLLTQGRIRVLEPAYDLLIESGLAPLASESGDDAPLQ